MAAQKMLVLFCVFMSCHVTLAAILRPDWFPYFRDEPQSARGVTISTRHSRNNGVNCPPDMSEYDCYHELMAVWTRVLAKDKRSDKFNTRQGKLNFGNKFSIGEVGQK